MTSCTILNSQLINKPKLYYPNLRDNHHSLQRTDYFAKHISPLQASLSRRKNSKLEERSRTNLPSLTEFRPTTKAEGLTAILAKIYNSEFCQICLVKKPESINISFEEGNLPISLKPAKVARFQETNTPSLIPSWLQHSSLHLHHDDATTPIACERWVLI
ncbi:unnamed protein product [Lepidochelys olivacea]